MRGGCESPVHALKDTSSTEPLSSSVIAGSGEEGRVPPIRLNRAVVDESADQLELTRWPVGVSVSDSVSRSEESRSGRAPAAADHETEI